MESGKDEDSDMMAGFWFLWLPKSYNNLKNEIEFLENLEYGHEV